MAVFIVPFSFCTICNWDITSLARAGGCYSIILHQLEWQWISEGAQRRMGAVSCYKQLYGNPADLSIKESVCVRMDGNGGRRKKSECCPEWFNSDSIIPQSSLHIIWWTFLHWYTFSFFHDRSFEYSRLWSGSYAPDSGTILRPCSILQESFLWILRCQLIAHLCKMLLRNSAQDWAEARGEWRITHGIWDVSWEGKQWPCLAGGHHFVYINICISVPASLTESWPSWLMSDGNEVKAGIWRNCQWSCKECTVSQVSTRSSWPVFTEIASTIPLSWGMCSFLLHHTVSVQYMYK